MIAPLLLAAAVALQAPAAEPRALQSAVQPLIDASGADVAVAMRTLDGRAELLMRADESFHAASTMKVPVMIELFRQARAGTIRLDDSLPVVNEFHSIVDLSPYTLDVGDDSDAEVYAHVGDRMTYRQLCDAMITVSSNLATNILIEHLGVENIRRTTAALGAPDMKVRRGVEDTKAFERGLNNTTTARALLALFRAIADGQAVDRDASDEMVAILKRQHFNERIPAGVPPGVPVAHKTGEIAGIQHDAGIVYAPRPFVLVILIRGLDDASKGSALAAAITRTIYEAMEK